MLSGCSLLLLFLLSSSTASSVVDTSAVRGLDSCFCQLNGVVDDCVCRVDTVDHFNNALLFDRLQSLLSKPYFKYFRYNPNKPCPFWTSVGKCASKQCGVTTCQPHEVPPAFQRREEKVCATSNSEEHVVDISKSSNQSHSGVDEGRVDDGELLDRVDNSVAASTLASLEAWRRHDEASNHFCETDSDDACAQCVDVDLTINPERYTGYSGRDAHRIWRAIYNDNCFKSDNGDNDDTHELCLEKRAFNRAISGLHTSISIHLCANYLLKKKSDGVSSLLGIVEDEWGPNLDEFLRRFNPDTTHNLGPQWLKNLYFVYLLELRALSKASVYLENQSFYTGHESEDKATLIAVKELLNLIRSFPQQFDEKAMFQKQGDSSLKREFRQHFLNVSRVMDCVTCDKCRLWGKLQVTGLGTALKILFNDNDNDEIDDADFHLSRQEIVALFNAFGKISTSIVQLDKFRTMISNQHFSSIAHQDELVNTKKLEL